MNKAAMRDPIERLGRRERRAWRGLEQRVRRQHDAEQMATLRSLAATGVGVTGLSSPDPDPGALGAPVEMIIAGRRLRVFRVHRRALSSLRDALAGIAAVPLTAVGRYGPYWVLTFKLATEPLVVLAEHLILLPDWGGGGRLVPTGPLGQLAG